MQLKESMLNSTDAPPTRAQHHGQHTVLQLSLSMFLKLCFSWPCSNTHATHVLTVLGESSANWWPSLESVEDMTGLGARWVMEFVGDELCGQLGTL